MLFILGLKAPGISTMRDYVNFGGTINNSEVEDVSDDADTLFTINTDRCHVQWMLNYFDFP